MDPNKIISLLSPPKIRRLQIKTVSEGVPSISELSSKIDSIQKDLNVLQEQLKYAVQMLSEQNVLLKKTARQQIYDESLNTNFPLKTEGDLENLNKEICFENEKAYVATMKYLLKNGGVLKNLKNILSPELTDAFNINGNHGKKCLKDMSNFYNAFLASIVLPPDGKYTNPEEMLRHAIQCQKKRFFKAKGVKNKNAAVVCIEQ